MTPEGWARVPLGSVTDVAIGGTPARNNPAYWDPEKAGGNRWVAISDLRARTIADTAEYISDAGVRNSNVKLVPAGTTVMSFKLSIGRAAIAACDLYTNEAIAAFHVHGHVDSRFLLYALPKAADEGGEADVAVKGKTLNKAKLVDLPLLLPPLREQRKIAAILSSLDDAIEATQAVIEQLHVVRQAMMAELLTRGLPGRHTRFKQTEVGEVPEGWRLTTIGSLGDLSGGNGFRPTDWATSGWPIIRIQNLNGSEDFNYFAGEPDEDWFVEPGELLFAWAGSRGASFGPTLWPGPRGVLNQHIYRIKPRSMVRKRYLYFLLRLITNEIEKRAHGFKSTLVHLRKHELTGWHVALPSLDEQDAAVDVSHRDSPDRGKGSSLSCPPHRRTPRDPRRARRMTSPGRGWNEDGLSERPAIEHLQRLGYAYVAPDSLDSERESFKETFLTRRLGAALKRLNPWLSDDNVEKATRVVTTVPATSLIEASEKLHTTLTYGTSIEQDRGDGKRGQTVRFFDFDHPDRNEFVVTRQFTVQGPKKHIRPDIVLLVNGIPLVIIECKSPTLGESWRIEATTQFARYQELEEGYRDLGARKLFEPVQLLVATCGQAAVYGTVTTPHRFFGGWKSMWPTSEADFVREHGRAPSAQEILFEGMLSPANLLDILRNFVVFERDKSTGRTLRKVCRYQQFAAVNKAIARARKARKPTERGGVVWHTQGSGKSLTMLWLALKLRRDEAHDNPTLVLVTDRKDLDDQITRTFHACGFPNPERAESVRDLRDLLSGPTGKTVLTTVQKFQELQTQEPGTKGGRRARDEYPELSQASNIFVLADEAHRTQYGTLAANLRKALPNACFFAFSGTPIDKKDRSTVSTFGSYIDTYTIQQAVADKQTVPIFYESRLPELRIVGNTLDAIFDRVFADRTDEEREAIKKKYATEAAIAGAPKRIEAICLDLIDHYTKAIQPGGFKAQVVAYTREIAALYKDTLDRLNAPASAVLFSATNKDDERLVRHHTTEEQRKDLIGRFLKKDDGLSILVVCDMLLTGFDAPVEQVMYLDSPLKEHTLLQAIARVNRTADGKEYGLIVDYWGVSEALEEALAIFNPSDVAGAMTRKFDELPRLQATHAAAMRFFARVKDKDDLEACVAILEPEDRRSEFELAFKRFAKVLDMVLPDPDALPYVGDARWLGKIRGTAAAKYRDDRIDVSDCGAKVRKLIEEAVIADGIQILVKQVSLFTPEFDEKIKALRTPEARASEMEHAIRSEIHVRLDDNPAFYTSLRERLEQIVADRKAQRIDAAEQLQLFEAVKRAMRGHAQAAESLGLTETGFAIYGLLASPGSAAGSDVDEPKKALASILEEQLAPQAAIVDWFRKEDVQREMRRLIKRQLKAAGYAASTLDSVAENVVALLKRRGGR